MIKMKYKKISLMNNCALLAESLFVEFRCSKNGISIKNLNDEWKFFHIDYIYLHIDKVKKYIKRCAEPELQTRFI